MGFTFYHQKCANSRTDDVESFERRLIRHRFVLLSSELRAARSAGYVAIKTEFAYVEIKRPVVATFIASEVLVQAG